MIRAWKFEDILRISEIEKECFGQEAWSYKTLVSGFETDAFAGVLFEDGGDIVGYGSVTVAADTADIGNIAVTEAFRGGGIGTEIVTELCSVASSRGAEKVFLEVRVSNSEAMRLYLKNGFKGIYARTRYYPDGEDCLVMARSLDGKE